MKTALRRGPHVEKRRWKRSDGTIVESPWYSMVFYVPTPKGSRRVYRLVKPHTDVKKVAEERMYKFFAAGTSPGGGGPLVKDVMDAYEKYLKTEAHSTWEAKRYWIEFWRAEYGHLRTGSFGLSHVTSAIAKMQAKSHADGTIGDELGVLRAAFNRAVEEKLITDHEVCKLKTKKWQSPERHVVWSKDELEAFSKELPGWAARLFALMLATGLRLGDAIALRWDAVKEDRIILRQQKSKDDVYVPLTAAGREVLAALPRVKEKDGKDNPFVFPGPGGQPRAIRSLRNDIKEARAASGIEDRNPHDLRRTYATQLLNAHVSKPLIAALLGQRTTRMVERYTHAEFDTLRAAAELAFPPQAPQIDQDGKRDKAPSEASTVQGSAARPLPD